MEAEIPQSREETTRQYLTNEISLEEYAATIARESRDMADKDLERRMRQAFKETGDDLSAAMMEVSAVTGIPVQPEVVRRASRSRRRERKIEESFSISNRLKKIGKAMLGMHD